MPDNIRRSPASLNPTVVERPAEVLAAAEQLHALGFQMVPTCAPAGGGCSAPWHEKPCSRVGKRPLVRDYRHGVRLHTIEELLGRLGAINVAIATGNGVVAIDSDSPVAEQEVQALLGDVKTPTRERRPARGRVWLYRTPHGVEVANRTHLGRSGAIDVRGVGGIAIAPPSRHLTGHVYRWVPGCEPWAVPLAVLPPGLVELAMAGPKVAEAAPASGPPPVAGLSRRVRELLALDPRLGRLWRGEGKASGDASPSGYDAAIAVALLKEGVPAEQVAAALMLRRPEKRVDYFDRTLAKARAFAGRRP